MEKSSRILIAGGTGLVGSSLVKKLQDEGFTNLLFPPKSELNFLNQAQVSSFFKDYSPEYVFWAAGKMGGIYANNTYRAEFIYENLMMQSNAIHQAYVSEVKRLIFFSCSCIYPKDCIQPMKEEHLLNGPLEVTNEPFALAKIAGMKMCESYNMQYGTDFISVIPTNLYGPNQNYEPLNTTVIPSLIRRFHEAKIQGDSELIIWGDGQAKRDFLFVDDLAEASIFLMTDYPGNETFNVGTEKEYSIGDVANAIKELVGFDGKLIFDNQKLGGVFRKLSCTQKLDELGWKAKTDLKDGLKITYEFFLKSLNEGDLRL